MNTRKPYDIEPSETLKAAEPMAVYGHTVATEERLYRPTPYEMEVIMKSKKEFEEGHFYTQEEVDKMVEEWLS